VTPLPPKVIAWIAGVIAILVGYSAFVAHQREVGRLQVLLAQADSTHQADSTLSVILFKQAGVASAQADSDRAAFRHATAGGSAIIENSRRSQESLRQEHEFALGVAGDSLATLAQARSELVKFATASDSAMLAMRSELALYQRQLALASNAIMADSLAIQAGLAATNAATKRAVDAERQRDILKREAPSSLGRYALTGAAFVVGAVIGRVAR
jgi:hypothetical protein